MAKTCSASLAPTMGEQLSEAVDRGDRGIAAPLGSAETVARLRDCAARLEKQHSFKVGQLVQWAPGLKNKRTPAYGDPVIIVEVLAAPLIDRDRDDSGSAYFREPLSVVAGELDPDGDLALFYYDGRRLEPYVE